MDRSNTLMKSLRGLLDGFIVSGGSTSISALSGQPEIKAATRDRGPHRVHCTTRIVSCRRTEAGPMNDLIATEDNEEDEPRAKIKK
jgi:hypothetical protein